eukprot:CAMPEP_0115886126 /NCGR_PEP_ID=MMETSP0287-20121206/31038_1 /TAXON_ID=412157 /ORGANISM="Chrysochromulina rotalis, Strain UIO044" /LENGTH=430 /DNA_ID=CAMNT_0003342583 /DNA_START=102 /DNA_END=1391 /DNA_ORIENTATION=-
MAKVGEGDQRWIVKEREDGANCNNWHWTTKDVSSHVKDQLNAALKGDIFPCDGPLANVRIKSCETTGEASVNNRKGRTFIIYELEMKIKWSGDLVDGDGSTLESGSGSMKLPDVSAESMDDLEVEFETKNRGTALSEAMRKQGVSCVKAAVQARMKQLQAEVTAQAASQKPPPAKGGGLYTTPAVAVPMPQPISVAPASAAAPAALPTAPPSAPKVSARKVLDDMDDDDEAPPTKMRDVLKRLRSESASTKSLKLSNLGVGDVHLKPLLEALSHSQVSVEEIDLTFNKLTDAGVHVLLKALATGTAMDLTKLFLGGNKVSVAGMALSQSLKQQRPDLLVNWHNQLPGGKSMCAVGTVYAASPAQKAGLCQGDSIIAFGPVQADDYKGVSESVVPVVKASVGKPIDVVVVRIGDKDQQVQQMQLTLTPQKW